MANLGDTQLNEDLSQTGGVRRKKPGDPMSQVGGPVSPEAYIYPGGPDGPVPPQTGNSETPRDRTPNQGPGTQNQPNIPTGQFNQPGTGPVRAQSAPSMPSAPSPASMQPFQPMAPPQGVQRKMVLGGAAPTSGLLGRAGGLLGGGMGVPQSGGPAAPDISTLIQQLVQQRRG